MLKTSFVNDKKLPIVVEPDAPLPTTDGLASLQALVAEHGKELRALLLDAGALLLRGFGLPGADEFGRFVRHFSGRTPLDYIGGASPRVRLGGGVYTSTEYPSHYTLSLHNELSYNYRWPSHLYFCCITPSAEGGETSLGDSRALLKSIDAGVVEQFRSKGVRYERNFHDGTGAAGLSWQAAYETDNPAAVEACCREGGVQFRWKPGGGLWTSQVRPATLKHPQTGAEVWFNQADGFHPSGMDQEIYRMLTQTMPEDELPLNAYFGDATPIDPAMLEHIRTVMWRETALFQWQPGDILVLDNILTAHGRMPYTGARKILLAMT
jgi:hypothetical protein